MKKRFMVLVALVCLVFAGCAGNRQVALTINSPFDKETAEKQMRPGNNTIRGSALLRQVGGGVVTCAGNDVILTPYSDYARNRITALYLNERGGIIPIVIDNGFPPQDVLSRIISTPVEPGYLELTKQAQCDAQGYFLFNNLADGDYFIITVVIWGGNSANVGKQGGYLMKKVHVEGGETKEVVINGQP